MNMDPTLIGLVYQTVVKETPPPNYRTLGCGSASAPVFVREMEKWRTTVAGETVKRVDALCAELGSLR